MKVDNIDKFWYVMRCQSRTYPQDAVTVPRVRHSTLEDASVEAIRLARLLPKANFVILEAVGFTKIKE